MTPQKKYKTISHNAAQLISSLLAVFGLIVWALGITTAASVPAIVAPVVELLIICITGILGVVIIGAIIVNLLIQIEQNTSATSYEAKKHIAESEGI